MGAFFKRWRRKIGVVTLVTAAALSCYCLVQPNRRSLVENSPPSPQLVETIANEPRPGMRSSPRPTDQDGKRIDCDGLTSKEILTGFVIDEKGLANDEHIETQMKLFSMCESSGWNQSEGWNVWVELDLATTLKQMRLDEFQLTDRSDGFGGKINWVSWRISPAYRLQLTTGIFKDQTHVSFPKIH